MLTHDATRSLVLNAPDPFAVREALADSRVLDHPDYNLQVHHTLEAAKVLRNMGLEAPAPIANQYRWPGKYKPFAHQVTMAETYTMHRRVFNLSEMGCVDGSTEYLTPTGWRRIDRYNHGAVGQYHPEDGRVTFVTPNDYIDLPCDSMIHVKTKYGIDQMLSDEHRVLVSGYKAPYRTTTLSATAFEAWHEDWLAGGGSGWSKATVPASFNAAGGVGVFLSDARLRVQIAVIADGHFSSRSSTSWCVVRLKKQRKKDRMRQLLQDAGMAWKETSNDTPTAQGFTVFRFRAPLRIKEFDDQFWAATPEQLRVVCDEVMHWDGSIDPDKASRRFCTTSKASADFVQYAYSATGCTARLSYADRGGVRHYTVTARDNGDPLMLCSMSSDGARRRIIERVPAPNGRKYCFQVPSGFLILRRNGCIFATGNSGKTAATLWAADWLMQTGRARKALVISPLSTLERVWASDIFDVLMHRTCVVVHGSVEKRLAALNADVDFYIVNHDGIVIPQVREAIARRPEIDLYIVDEAGMFRNYQTKKYKALEQLTRREDARLWLMTGTPCPNAPTDAWALAKLVDPSRVPKYFGAFKRATMLQVSQFKWVPKADAFETAFAAMQPAVRFKKEDCLDLPPVTVQDHTCTMTQEQQKAFNTLRATMVAEAKNTQITAANAADKIGKLRQILCGAIKDTATGEYVVLPHGPRVTALMDAIDSASAKVLVIVPFKGIVGPLAEEVGKKYSVGILNGDVTVKERNRVVEAFKHQTDPHVLICHPKVMSHGLNLTEADMTIFYAPIYSNDEYQQVTERFNRAGQTRKMTIVRLGAHPLEWQIYNVIDSKKESQNSILDLYRTVTE